MIGQQLGPYRIESELGSGEMGKVYLAEAVEAAGPKSSACRSGGRNNA